MTKNNVLNKAAIKTTAIAEAMAIANENKAHGPTVDSATETTALPTAQSYTFNSVASHTDSMLDSLGKVKNNLKEVSASAKNSIRCIELLLVCNGLDSLVNSYDKNTLSGILQKAKGLSAPIKNAIRKIVPAMQYKGGLITFDIDGEHMTSVTTPSGKQKIVPVIDHDAFAYLCKIANATLTRAMAGKSKDNAMSARDFAAIDFVSDDWKATFPNLDPALTRLDVAAWREKQIKAMVKAGFAESAAIAFVSNQSPTA